MNTRIHGVRVEAIAAAIPEQVLDLTELSGEYGASEVRRIVKSTGIERVHVAPESMCTSDLCEAAARAMMRPEDYRDVGAVVFVSQTPDHRLPATSALLQDRLGLATGCAAFDINYGCSGFVYGLLQGAMLLSTGCCDKVLVCAGDVTTRHIHSGDRSVRMVFGDGGSACLLAASGGELAFAAMTDGSGKDHLIVPAGGCRRPSTAETAIGVEDEKGNVRSEDDLYMNGIEIMNFSLREVPPVIDAVLARRGWARDEVGVYALHQANAFMLDYLRKKMRLDREAVPVAMAKTGNTGPASIPLMLAIEQRRLRDEGRLHRTLLCGFGVGLSVAAATCDLSETRILDPVYL